MVSNNRGRRNGSPAEVYAGLRRQILTVNPADVGLTSTQALPRVWGAMIEIGPGHGSVTLVALADGTTSLYTSAGGGIIGAGEHSRIAAATRALLAVVEQHLAQMPVRVDTTPPAAGRVVLRALTYEGHRTVEAAEDDLGHGGHAMSPVFYAVHDVLTELRLLEEARR
jgi:hypothetical protein